MIALVLNLITLLLVILIIVFAYLVYKHRPEKDMTALEIFEAFQKEPSVYSRRAFTEIPSGDIGSFTGYTWTDDNLVRKYKI